LRIDVAGAYLSMILREIKSTAIIRDYKDREVFSSLARSWGISQKRIMTIAVLITNNTPALLMGKRKDR
jgi:hypothetical protein